MINLLNVARGPPCNLFYTLGATEPLPGPPARGPHEAGPPAAGLPLEHPQCHRAGRQQWARHQDLRLPAQPRLSARVQLPHGGDTCLLLPIDLHYWQISFNLSLNLAALAMFLPLADRTPAGAGPGHGGGGAGVPRP